MQRLLLLDARPARARRRLHHRARNLADVRGAGRRGARRCLGAGGPTGRCCLRGAWARARDACGRRSASDAAARALPAQCIWSRPARRLRAKQAERLPDAHMARFDRGFAGGAACCSSPTNSSTLCRSVSSSTAMERKVDDRRRRPGVRPRRRDRRAVAGPRRSRRRARKVDRASMAARRCSSITAMSEPRPAIRCRRFAGTATSRSSSMPGEQDLTSHVDFEALGRAAAMRRRERHARRRRRATGSNRLGIGAAGGSACDRATRTRADEIEDARRSPVPRRADGQLFKVMAHSLRRMAGPGGVRTMTISYRRGEWTTPQPSTASSATASATPSRISTGRKTSKPSSASSRSRPGKRSLTTSASPSRSPKRTARSIGFVKLGPPALPVEADGPWIELRQLYVLKEWRGLGAAAALMDWAHRRGQGARRQELYLTVYTDNRPRPATLRALRLRRGRPL